MPQLTWAQTTLCTPSDVRSRITSPEVMLGMTQNAAAVDAAIQAKITLSKGWMKQELVDYFQGTIPGDIRGFLAFKRSQLDTAQSVFSRELELGDRGSGSWNFPTYGYLLPDGILMDGYGLGLYSGQIPPLRFNYGAPTNGTSGAFAGAVTNGTVLADMKNRVLYINREIDDPPVSPVWDKFIVSDALDFILDATVLNFAAVSLTIVAMVQDGAWRNRAGLDNPSLVAYMLDAEKMWRDTYAREMKRAKNMLDIDFSGSGEMNDWKRGFVRQEIAVAG